MVVAILDTGLDYTHEAFVTMPKNPAWSKQYVADRMAASSIFNAKASVDDVYYNAKVPFAYDYADDDADVFPQYSSTGTHVAGIVGARATTWSTRRPGETFLGVAPGGTAGHLQGVHGQLTATDWAERIPLISLPR